jgi:hypothetical protein
MQSPRTIVGASVVCADTDAEANVEIPSLDLAWLLRKTEGLQASRTGVGPDD